DIDITEQPMEVGPTTHYIMGGVRVDPDTQMTRLPGLFAAGECAAGINGANRLGGNSLSDLLVFGKRAGEFAAKFARENRHTAIDLKNLLTVSEAITRAALDRKESRGAQFREDYPNKEERFAKVNTIVSKSAVGSMQLRLEQLPELPEYLKQVIQENK